MKFRSVIAFGIVLGGGACQAQTPPYIPKTPDVVVPPPNRVAPPPAGEALPGTPAPGQVENRPLTADEAAEIALRFGPTVEQARAAIAAAHGVTLQARSGLLPSAGLDSSYSRLLTTSGATGSRSTSGFSNAVTVNQLVFDFNRTRDLVSEREAQERAARHALTVAQADLVLNAKQLFYNYVQARDLVRVSQDNVDNLQAELALATARLNTGLGEPGDVVQAKTSLANAVIDLTNARGTEETSRVDLALTLGIDPRTPIVPAPSEEPETTSTDLDALVRRALGRRPEILEAQENVRAAQLGVSVARKNNAPSVSVDAGVTSGGDVQPFGNPSTSVGISLSWPFFDSGFTAGLTQEAQANAVIARSQLRQQSLTVISDVSTALVTLQNAEEQFATAQVGVANAEEYLRIARGRYQGGLGQFLDVTTAQAALFSAQSTLETTRNDVRRARATLAHATGDSLNPTNGGVPPTPPAPTPQAKAGK